MVSVAIMVVCAIVGLALLTGAPTIRGVARPGAPQLLTDEAKREVLSHCQRSETTDWTKLRLGPAVPFDDGYLVIAAAPDGGQLHLCTSDGLYGSDALARPTPDVKVTGNANLSRGSIAYAGFGLCTPEVARVQIKESQESFQEAQVFNGMYAYSGRGSNPGTEVDLRAYDANGKLIFRT